MINDKLVSLVGIPWGYKAPPEEANCLSLMLYAQEVLFGRKINIEEDQSCSSDNLVERSNDISQYMNKYGYKVETPQAGDVGFMPICGYRHIMTFLSSNEVLHILINKTSRINRIKSLRGIEIWRVL
jgi:hypothetical protein